MNEKKKKSQKVWKIISITLGSLIILGFIVVMILELAIPNTEFASWAKENIADITSLPGTLEKQYPTIIRCVILIAVIFALSKILRMIFRKVMEKSNRAKTVITLLDGIIKYGAAIALIFLVLDAFGVNTAAIWESVGVLTLIVGLGAQSLIADIIAGIFIIFENEYNVGEIVSIDDFRGTVREIGIRATKIVDCAGNIKIINNSDIKNVVNLSRELSLASIDAEFSYDYPVEKVEKIFKDNLARMKEKIPAIVEGPYYKGVTEYKNSNTVVKLIAMCKEEDRFQVQRDMLREYHKIFLENGVDFDYERYIINNPKSERNPDKKTKVEAESFIEEQKEASYGLDDQHKD